MSNENTPIGLAEMIDSLRQELLVAKDKAKDSEIKFEIENIDLELQVKVERDTNLKSGIGIKFWVVNADLLSGEHTNKQSSIQTIKLSLSAKDKQGRKLQTRG